MSVPGATLPGVTADHTQPVAACCEDHDPDGTGVETIQCCENCPLTDADAGLEPGPGLLLIDIGAINQRELERRVAAGEPLPEGVTAEQVAAWHDEYAGPVATIDGHPTDIEVRHG